MCHEKMKVYEDLRTRESAALNFCKLCRALSEPKRAENAKRAARRGDRKRKPLRFAVREPRARGGGAPRPRHSRDRTAENTAVFVKRDRNKSGTRPKVGSVPRLRGLFLGFVAPPCPLVFNRYLRQEKRGGKGSTRGKGGRKTRKSRTRETLGGEHEKLCLNKKIA